MTSVPSRRLLLAESLLAFAAALAVAYPAATQGFNLLDDGLWLLGAEVLRDGGVLYRDLFVIYGPAKFVLLVPFLVLAGGGALALSALKATTLAFAAALGYAAVRSRGPAWIAAFAPLAALALWTTRPRYVAAGALALLLAACLDPRRGPRAWALLGLAAAGVAAFGLDAAAYALVTTIGTLLLARRLRPDRARLLTLAGGAAAGMLLLAIAGLLTGSLEAALWDAVVYPATRFAGEMGLSPLDSARDAEVTGSLFREYPTGEVFAEAWPGHRAMLAAARRLLYLALLAVPPLGAWFAWRRGDRALPAALAAFAAAGWITAGVRGEVSHLAAGWLGTAWLLPLLAAEAAGTARRAWRVAVGLMAVAALLPLALEPLWLDVHVDRPGLAVWERATAGIRLARERIEGLEAVAARVAREVDGPAVFWPARPGLNFFFDVPPASPQATLLGGEVRDPQQVLADLAAVPDHSVLLHPPLSRDPRSHKDVAPAIWAGLRRGYRVADRFAGGPDEFTLLRPLPADADAAALPLAARLHDERAAIADAASPPLAPDTFVGQDLPVGPQPLVGMALRFHADRAVVFPLAIRVRALDDGRPGRVLARSRRDLELPAGQALRFVPFGPVADTAGRRVLVEFGAAAPAPGVRLLWNTGEAYDGGRARVNGRPAAGALYFLSY